MIKAWVPVGALLAVLIAPGVTPVTQAQVEEAVHWKGEITMIHRRTAGSGSVGEVVETSRLRVDWKESHRIEVKNEQGELTGVLVILADHNSRWSADVSGMIQSDSGCSRRIYGGAGTGTETLESGWIYFSLSDDDPILDVMPHGTYHIDGHHTEKPSVAVTYESGLCFGPFRTQTSEGSFFGLMLVDIGRELWRPLPCTTPETCRSATFRASALPASAPWIPAEALKAKLERDFIPASVTTGLRTDPEPRVVTDNMMRGQYLANVIGTDAAGFDTVELTWDLEREVEPSAILELAAEDWLPEWNEGGETTPVEITARIEGDRGETEWKFRFTLYEVTREPGYALNAGEQDDTSPDLEFEASQPGFTKPEPPPGTSDTWRIETTELVNETTVAIRAHDYGAWAKLRCEVNVDGEWIDCRAEDGGDFITIPRDTDEDRLADSWEDEHGVRDQSETDDEDAIPADQNSNGDGISLYEEYRGFVNEDGEHQRLDPGKKELFVRDQHGLARISNFETASELTVIYIGDDGWTGPVFRNVPSGQRARLVNFNTSGHGHEVDQHALHVVNGQGNGRGIGINPSLQGRLLGYIESPRTAGRLEIYLNTIEDVLRTSIAEVNMGRQRALQPEEVELFKEQWVGLITAHEMGHGVGVRHHSPRTEGDGHCFMRYMKSVRALAGWERFPYMFSKVADCVVGPGKEARESCWGQIQVSSRLP